MQPGWKRSLAFVDRQTKPAIMKIIAHMSESGWNLSIKHPGYITKFPQEIVDTILSYILTLDHCESLHPITTTSNLKKRWVVQHYDIGGSPMLDRSYQLRSGRSMSWRKMQDCEGTYTELRLVGRKLIDATFLRINKTLHQAASGTLHGGNPLSSNMRRKYWKYSPGTCHSNGKRYYLHRPSPGKPSFDLFNIDSLIANGLAAIQQGCHLQNLPGWIFHDPFLRFLYTIGARNAALIRSLHFTGKVLFHVCTYSESHQGCSDDLVHSLWLYMPFLQEFCTGLETLTTDFHDDSFDDLPAQTLGADEPISTEESLRPLLEEEIMQISSLRRIEVRNIQDETPDFAKPTIDRVAQRAKVRAVMATKWNVHILKLKRAQGEDTGPGCELCGEDHISAEC
ncbi:hypothetical protein IFR05_011580 [Cadophora sp. M221]|nr:hypothetical protein IFR05_011580 [Cadophora sp. M221]